MRCYCHRSYNYHFSCFVYLLLLIALFAVCRPIICFLLITCSHLCCLHWSKSHAIPVWKFLKKKSGFFPRICLSPFVECLQTHYVFCVTIFLSSGGCFAVYQGILHICSDIDSVGWGNPVWTGFIVRWTTVRMTLMWCMFVGLYILLWLVCVDTYSRMGAYGIKT